MAAAVAKESTDTLIQEATDNANPVEVKDPEVPETSIYKGSNGNGYSETLVTGISVYHPTLAYHMQVPKVQFKLIQSQTQGTYMMVINMKDLASFESDRAMRERVLDMSLELVEMCQGLFYDIAYRTYDRVSAASRRIIDQDKNGINLLNMYEESYAENAKAGTWRAAALAEIANNDYRDEVGFALPLALNAVINEMHGKMVKVANCHMHPIIALLQRMWEEAIFNRLRPYQYWHGIVSSVLENTTQYSTAPPDDGTEYLGWMVEVPRSSDILWDVSRHPRHHLVRNMIVDNILFAAKKYIPYSAHDPSTVNTRFAIATGQTTIQMNDLTTVLGEFNELSATTMTQNLLSSMLSNRFVRMNFQIGVLDQYNHQTFIACMLMKLCIPMRCLSEECVNKIDNWLVINFLPFISDYPRLLTFISQMMTDDSIISGTNNLMTIINAFVPAAGNVGIAIRDFLAFAQTTQLGDGWADAGLTSAVPFPPIGEFNPNVPERPHYYYNYMGHAAGDNTMPLQAQRFRAMIMTMKMVRPVSGGSRASNTFTAALNGMNLARLTTQDAARMVHSMNYAQRQLAIMPYAAPVSTRGSFGWANFAPNNAPPIAVPGPRPSATAAELEAKPKWFNITLSHIVSYAMLAKYDGLLQTEPRVSEIMQHSMALNDAMDEFVECYNALRVFVNDVADWTHHYSAGWRFAKAISLMRKVPRPPEFNAWVSSLQDKATDYFASSILEVPVKGPGYGYKQRLINRAYHEIMDNVEQFGVSMGAERSPEHRWDQQYGFAWRRPRNAAFNANTFSLEDLANLARETLPSGENRLTELYRRLWTEQFTMRVTDPFRFSMTDVVWKPKVEKRPFSIDKGLPLISGTAMVHYSDNDLIRRRQNLIDLDDYSDQEWYAVGMPTIFSSLDQFLNYLRTEIRIFRAKYKIVFDVPLTKRVHALNPSSDV